MAAKFVVAYLL